MKNYKHYKWYDEAIKALQLNGMAENTQFLYARAVRLLADFYHKEPDLITEDEIKEYFLHRKNVDKWASSTLRICHSGIRFYFTNVLRRDWHIFSLIRVKTERTLPCIVSKDEVLRIFKCVKTFHNYAFFSTVYSCGLRLQEALNLQVTDIDGERMLIHVHRGKGAKDRYVPVPQNVLILLRKYWNTHRNPTLIFPAMGRNCKKASTAKFPMAKGSVQNVFRQAVIDAGINKRRVTIHSLRHAYATHLLEAGVNVHIIQRYMGHARLESTLIYLHLTTKGAEDAYEVINQVMKGIDHVNNS